MHQSPLLRARRSTKPPAHPRRRENPLTPSQQISPQAEQPEDYTSRLLKAKKRVWEERPKNDE